MLSFLSGTARRSEGILSQNESVSPAASYIRFTEYDHTSRYESPRRISDAMDISISGARIIAFGTRQGLSSSPYRLLTP